MTSWLLWRKCCKPLAIFASSSIRSLSRIDQAAARDALGHVVQHGADVGVLLAVGVVEQVEDAAELRFPRLGRQVLSHFRVEQHQAHGVVLVEHQVRQGGGEVAGVAELAQFAALERHRLGAIDEDVGAEVRLVLEELDVVLVGAGEDLPVDGAGIVAGRVGAVVEVLDGEAVVGAAVAARQEPLDDLARHQLHVADAGEAFGVEVFLAHVFLTTD